MGNKDGEIDKREKDPEGDMLITIRTVTGYPETPGQVKRSKKLKKGFLLVRVKWIEVQVTKKEVGFL